MKLKSLFRRPGAVNPVRSAYEAIVAAARHPRFYAEWGVPDTVDGRFDLIVLHVILLLERLKSEANSDFAQDLTEELFFDMDRSLREMGVGDLSVGKKVRRMAEAFYGRALAYGPHLRAGDTESLAEALRRNIFAGEGESPGASLLAAYAIRELRHLESQPGSAFLAGRPEFAEP